MIVFIYMISLVSLLQELNIQQKNLLGHGVEHDVYPSKNNPEIVYKVGFEASINRLVKASKTYPKFFPIVYKVGKLKNKENRYFVAVEKLNTNRVEKEWEQLEEIFTQLGYINKNMVNSIDQLFVEIVLFDEVEYDSNELFNKLKQTNKKYYNLFVKWVNFLHQVNNIVKPYKNNYPLDIHSGNFGYDQQGNMKCLDI